MYAYLLEHGWVATGEILRTNAHHPGQGDEAIELQLIEEEPQPGDIPPLAQRMDPP